MWGKGGNNNNSDNNSSSSDDFNKAYDEAGELMEMMLEDGENFDAWDAFGMIPHTPAYPGIDPIPNTPRQ